MNAYQKQKQNPMMSPEKEKERKACVSVCVCLFILKKIRSQPHSANTEAYHLGILKILWMELN